MNNKKMLWIILLLVFVSSAYSMDVSVVTGDKVGNDVSHDFGKAIIKVSPEQAQSLSNVFEQILTITNKYDVDLYFFIDQYGNGIKETTLNSISYKNVEVSTYETVCSDVLNKTDNKNYSVCENVVSGTETVQEPVYNLLNKDVSEWGNIKHYYSTDGVLLKKGETKQFLVKYETITKTGKWNARIWASVNDDWASIKDDKLTALFDYTIDPTWTRGTAGLSSYYKMDEGSGTWASDIFSTNGLTLTSTTWTTEGKIYNATFYDGGNDYSRNSTTTGMPTSIGTVSVWINRTSNNTRDDILELDDGAGTASSRIVLYNSGGSPDSLYIFIAGTNCLDITPFSMTTNIYHHVVFRWNTTSDIYNISIDGVHLGGTVTACGNPTGTSSRITVGNNQALGPQWFAGSIDELGIWNVYLSDSEVESLYNNGSGLAYPFDTVEVGNFTVSYVVNYTTPVYETNNYDFKINVSYGLNVSDIDTVLLNYSGNTYSMSLESNGSGTNFSWKQFIYNHRIPLIEINNTNASINYTFTARYDNGTNTTNTTSNYNIPQYWSYYPLNIFIENQAIETHNTTWNVSYVFRGNMTDVSVEYISQYNDTNTTGTLYQNSSTSYNVSFSFRVPFLNSTDLNKMMVLVPYVNVSFNGTSYQRNNSLSANQGIYKMILTNCTNLSYTNSTTQQFYVRDIVTDNLLNASTNLNYVVWLPENYGVAGLSRNYVFNFTSFSSPRICLYPNSTSYTFGSVNFSVDLNYTTSMTGYLSSSGELTNTSLSNTTTTTIIYLTNASAVQDVTITVTDQNDNELTNYTVRAYLYSNSTYSLVDTEVTNLQGQVKFNLYIIDRLYQFRVSYPNGSIATIQPSSGGTTIISTSFTIKVYLSPIASLVTSIGMMNINHTLTYNNVSGLVNLTYNDSSTNLTSYNCLIITNLTNGVGTILATNCSSNQTGTLTYVLTGNGTFLAQYVATNIEDGNNYLVDNLFIYRGGYQNLRQEGMIWAFIFIGTITMIGLFINPILGIIFLELGILGSMWLGILPLGWGAFMGVLVGGVFVAFIMGRE